MSLTTMPRSSGDLTKTMLRPRSIKRLFRFRLRTLLVFVSIMCVVFGIMTSRAQVQRRVTAAIKESGGIVEYDYQLRQSGIPRQNPVAPGPEWLRKLLGIDYFATVVYVKETRVDDLSIKSLSQLPSLRFLELSSGHLSDDAAASSRTCRSWTT